jgi:hypothetical protein
MKTTRSSILVSEVQGYTKLQEEMHDALRAQHSEWIEADCKSSTCDYYESLFAGVLVSHRAHERPNDREFAKNSRSFNGFRTSGNCIDLTSSLVYRSQSSTGIRCADTLSTKGDLRL